MEIRDQREDAPPSWATSANRYLAVLPHSSATRRQHEKARALLEAATWWTDPVATTSAVQVQGTLDSLKTLRGGAASPSTKELCRTLLRACSPGIDLTVPTRAASLPVILAPEQSAVIHNSGELRWLVALELAITPKEILALRSADVEEFPVLDAIALRIGGSRQRMVPVPASSDLAQHILQHRTATRADLRLWPWSDTTDARQLKELLPGVPRSAIHDTATFNLISTSGVEAASAVTGVADTTLRRRFAGLVALDAVARTLGSGQMPKVSSDEDARENEPGRT